MVLLESPDFSSSASRMLLFGSAFNEQYNNTVGDNTYTIRFYSTRSSNSIGLEVYSHQTKTKHQDNFPKGTRLITLQIEAQKIINEFEVV